MKNNSIVASSKYGEKPRVLFVGAFPPPGKPIFGGQITACRTLINSSFSQKFDIIGLDSTQISNPPPGLTVRLIRSFFRVVRFCMLLIKSRPNAVLLFSAVGASTAEKGLMGWLARIAGIPVLMFPRGAELIEVVSKSIFKRIWILASLRAATYFLCQGPAWQKFAVNVVGFRINRAPIVPNWTATDALLAIGRRRTSVTHDRPLQLLFLAWLEKEKGIFELLEACECLANSYNFNLVIAGRGHAECRARRFIERGTLMGRVEFAGWVEGEKLRLLLEKSDIFVLPSWSEGFPNAMIEAMAAKMAVVVSAVGNIPDILKNRENAMLVPPHDVNALLGAIQYLLANHDFRYALASRGHKFVEENHSVDVAVDQLSKVIFAAIEEREGENREEK